MVKMRKKEKWILVFTLLLIFSGIFVIAFSRSYDLRKVGNIEEDGVRYAVSGTALEPGTNITRYFDKGELLSIRFSWGNPPSAVISDFPYDFKIIAPDGEESEFTFWMAADYSQTTGDLEITIDELIVSKVGGLILDNSSIYNWLGETTTSGDYTLVFTSDYTIHGVELTYLAFIKIYFVRDYQYTYIWPFGAGFMIIGTVVASWIIITNNRRPGQVKHLR